MAQSALATQLRKLRAPQTDLLRETRRRVSLLFDHSAAAALDTRTVHQIGLNGFKRLVDIDRNFEQFGKALFAEPSRDFERAVQTPEVNAQLDSVISEFLVRVSPYVLLQPAQEALEWLIYRFHIHAYNESALIACVLPHHDTALFARALQLFDRVADEHHPFHWLNVYRREGKPVPKIDVYRQCARDISLLVFVGKAVVGAAEVFENRTSGCKAIMGFYVQCVSGTLENSKSVTDSHVSLLLPFFLGGLRSKNDEFRLATHFLLAQVFLKTKLQEKFVDDILDRFVEGMEGRPPTTHDVSILYVICFGQNIKSFPLSCVRVLLPSAKAAAAFGSTLQEAQEDPGVPVIPILAPIVHAVLAAAGEQIVARVNTVAALLARVDLAARADDVEIAKFLTFLLTRIDGAMDIAKEHNVAKKMRAQLQKLWQQLETSYSTAYDSVVRKGLMKGKHGGKNKIMALLEQTVDGADLRDPATQRILFLRLNHPSAGVRRAAYAKLADGIVALDEDPDVDDFPQFVHDVCSEGMKTEADPHCLAPLLTRVDPELLERLLPVERVVAVVESALASQASRRTLSSSASAGKENVAAEAMEVDGVEEEAEEEGQKKKGYGELLVPALKVLDSSRSFDLGSEPVVLRRLVLFFLGCESFGLFSKVAAVPFVSSCPVFASLGRIVEGKMGMEARVAALVAGFGTEDGLALLADVLELCHSDPRVGFASSARLHVVAAKCLFGMELSGCRPVGLLARICSHLVQFLKTAKFMKPKEAHVAEILSKSFDWDSSSSPDTARLLASLSRERCSWHCAAFLVAGAVRGLRLAAASDRALCDDLSARRWWSTLDGDSDAARFVAAYLETLDFVVGRSAADRAKRDKRGRVPGQDGADEDEDEELRPWDSVVLRVFGTITTKPDWNVKALVAAWRGRTFGRFAPSAEFKIRAVSLLPPVLAASRFRWTDARERHGFLGSLVVSLLADPKRSSREAGLACLHFVTRKAGKKGEEEDEDGTKKSEEGYEACTIAAPAWLFVLNALKSRGEEIVMDGELLSVVFAEALKMAGGAEGKRRSAAKTKIISSDEILAELVYALGEPPTKPKAADRKSKPKAEQQDPGPPFFVRIAMLKLLEKSDPQSMLKYGSALVRDVVERGAQLLADLDAGEKLQLPPVFEEFVRQAVSVAHVTPGKQPPSAEATTSFALILAALQQQVPVLQFGDALKSPEELVLDEVSADYFSSLPRDRQDELLDAIVGVVVDADARFRGSATAAAAAGRRVRRAIRRVLVDGRLAASHLDITEAESSLSKMMDGIDGGGGGGGERRGRRRSAAVSVPKVDSFVEPSETRSAALRAATRFRIVLETLCAVKKLKLRDAHLVVPVLFRRLEALMKLNDSPSADFATQLCLDLLYKCCELCQATEDARCPLTENDFRIQTVLKCVKQSRNTAVKSRAFLLLGLAGSMFPTHLLDSVMSIFTFMGESILCQDDAYTFEVIKKTISAILPPLLESQSKEDADVALAQIIRVFVVALHDIPPHRRKPLFLHIFDHVRLDLYLWMILAVFVEGGLGRAADDDVIVGGAGPGRGGLQPRVPGSVEVAVELCSNFDTVIQMNGCRVLLARCRKLPLGEPGWLEASRKKPKKTPKRKDGRKQSLEEIIFDVETHTVPDVRLFHYSVLYLVGRVLSSEGFSHKFLEADGVGMETLRGLTRDVVRELVGYMDDVNASLALCRAAAQPAAVTADGADLADAATEYLRYGRALLHRAADGLDKVKELLPVEFYLDTLIGILETKGEQIVLVRKAVEMMKLRLQDVRDVDAESLTRATCARLVRFVQPFVGSAVDSWKRLKDENWANAAQNGFMIIKLLAQISGKSHSDLVGSLPEFLAELLNDLESMADESASLLSFALVAAGGVVAVSGNDAIVALNQLVPPMVKILANKKLMNESELLCGSALTALQKILELHPRFVTGDRLNDLIVAVSVIPSLPAYVDSADGVVKAKLVAIKHAISGAIETRVFCPAMLRAYEAASKEAAARFGSEDATTAAAASATKQRGKKRKEKKPEPVAVAEEPAGTNKTGGVDSRHSVVVEFMSSLVESHFAKLRRQDVGASLREIEAMFLKLFDYRRFVMSRLPARGSEVDGVSREAVLAEIDRAEDGVVRAFLSPILKLTADGFSPIFYRLHHWAARAEDLQSKLGEKGSGPLRLITFYRLCETLSARLKDLFEPFAEHVFVEMVAVLRHFVKLTPETAKERRAAHAAEEDVVDDDDVMEVDAETPKKKKKTTKMRRSESARPEDADGERKDPRKPGGDPADDEFLAHAGRVGADNELPVLRAVLATLGNCFAFCPPASFVSRQRFEFVARPLVDQLENARLAEAEVRAWVMEAVGKLGSALATASKDAMWQTLSKLVMLKALHKNGDVRLTAIKCEEVLINALGRDAVASLTPELLPAVSELMEDQDERVEKEAHSLLLQMEEILGERLEKYL